MDRLIASGGVGAVYLAFDQRLKREVAIKVLFNNSLKDRHRFQREARLLAELEHETLSRYSILEPCRMKVTLLRTRIKQGSVTW